MGHWTVISRRKGNRSGVGSVNHCAYGRGISYKTVLDWRPFEYVTVDTVDGSAMFREMMLFESLHEGRRTKVEVRIKMFKPIFLPGAADG